VSKARARRPGFVFDAARLEAAAACGFQEGAETHSDATAVPILRNGLKLLSKQDGALTLRRNPRRVQL